MKKILFLCLASLLLVSCASGVRPKSGGYGEGGKGIEDILGEYEREEEAKYVADRESYFPHTALLPEEDPTRLTLRDQARKLVGKKGRTITVNGRRFSNDCSGMVRGVYSAVGIDLMAEAASFGEDAGGVEIIFETYKDAGWSDGDRLPRAGDLIFFNNSYDKNRNGKWDDPLTHVSLVTGVEEDGTVVYVHHVSRGVQRYRMNLDQKGVFKAGSKRMNDFLRRRPRRDKDQKKYLSDALFFSFVDVIGSKRATR